MAHQPVKQPRTSRLDADELSVLCEQIALIIRSGLPLHDGVEALSDSYRHTRYAQRFSAMNEAVLASGSLYQGIVAAGIFPKYMTEMANIGERTGELDNVMTDLSLYYQQEAKIRRSIVNAVTYPTILIVIMTTLIVVLVTNVLPIFDGVFRNMGIDATMNPWLGAGVSVGKTMLIIAGALIFLLVLALILMRADHSGRVRATIFAVIPALRKIDNKISASRFASVMAMMLRSGYPLDDSMKLIGGIVTNEDLSHKLDACRVAMENGLSFPDAVDQLGIFEPLHGRMIRMGFQAGQIDIVMKRLSDIYDGEVDDAIANIVSIIEPTLVALMSVIIGAILLAVMLPLLSLLGGMA